MGIPVFTCCQMLYYQKNWLSHTFPTLLMWKQLFTKLTIMKSLKPNLTLYPDASHTLLFSLDCSIQSMPSYHENWYYGNTFVIGFPLFVAKAGNNNLTMVPTPPRPRGQRVKNFLDAQPMFYDIRESFSRAGCLFDLSTHLLFFVHMLWSAQFLTMFCT